MKKWIPLTVLAVLLCLATALVRADQTSANKKYDDAVAKMGEALDEAEVYDDIEEEGIDALDNSVIRHGLVYADYLLIQGQLSQYDQNWFQTKSNEVEALHTSAESLWESAMYLISLGEYHLTVAVAYGAVSDWTGMEGESGSALYAFGQAHEDIVDFGICLSLAASKLTAMEFLIY